MVDFNLNITYNYNIEWTLIINHYIYGKQKCQWYV